MLNILLSKLVFKFFLIKSPLPPLHYGLLLMFKSIYSPALILIVIACFIQILFSDITRLARVICKMSFPSKSMKSTKIDAWREDKFEKVILKKILS